MILKFICLWSLSSSQSLGLVLYGPEPMARAVKTGLVYRLREEHMWSNELELWREALRNHPKGLMVNVGATLGVGVILSKAPTCWVWAWLLVSLSLTVLRFTGYLVFWRALNRNAVARWHQPLMEIGVLTSGFIWASLAWWGIPYFEGDEQFTILVILSALAGGATGTLAPLVLTGTLYTLLMIIPACLQLVFIGGTDNLSLAILGAIFAWVMASTHRSNHELLARTISLARDKQDLIEELSSSTDKLTRANVNLEERVEERTKALAHSANHDLLTGLLNRRGVLQEEERSAQPGEHSLLVLFIDLDRFKQINDGLGHDWGDVALQAVASRLQECVSQLALTCAPVHCRIGRWGGDEFLLVLTGPFDEQPVCAEWIESLQRRLCEPYEAQGRILSLGACIGVAQTPFGSQLPLNQTIAWADMAAGEAKRQGRGRIVHFSDTLLQRQRRKLNLLGQLAHAHQDGSLQLLFQPLVDAKTRLVVSYEALLRWNCPGLGPISPAEFIPLAEESDHILLLGEWALQAACLQAASWPGAHPPKVAVNTSLRQLVETDRFCRFLDKLLAQSQLPASRLVIEVTESIFDEHNLTRTLETLRYLRQRGIEIHLDDFGTGYSSLARLHDFPLHAIKIDKHFVWSRDERSVAVIEGALLIAHRFGLRVIAEGIEQLEQADRLATLGVDELQGYYFGYPRPELVHNELTLQLEGTSRS